MKKVLIKDIIKNSIAEELEIQSGDILISINNQEIIDVLDYKFHMSDEYVTLEIEHDGEIYEYEIEKELNEDIGLIFENELIDNPKRCQNNCVFCFMDQLPNNMRNTLIFKDDDYRLSFLSGNYVTLTNMKDEDIDRIIKYRLSPINISIHTTNIETRKKLINNRFAGEILKYIQKLYDNEIHMNGQIVLCPDMNDKDELVKTIEDISVFYPYMQSVSIVPVGLTKYRDKLHQLRPFTIEEMSKTIDDISKLQVEYREKFNSNFVYLSDEFYLKGNRELPNMEHYDEFPQLENGVGMVRLFVDQFNDRLDELMGYKVTSNRKITVVTGKLVEQYIRDCANKINEKFGNIVEVKGIVNNFFGENITVTGLLTATDIYEQLKDEETGNAIIICENMLKDDEDIFLDNITVEQLSERLGKPVVIVANSGEAFLEEIIQYKE